MSNVLGAAVMVAPSARIGDYTLVAPSDLNLDAMGESIPCEATDSDGIARCKRFQPLVMFLGGAKDPEYKPVLDRLFPGYEQANEPFQDVGYGAWQTGPQIRSLALHWTAQRQKVALVGHSYGGDTVMDVARELSAMGKPPEIVVTLDPVSRSGPRAEQPKPRGVKRWLNVYVDYAIAKRGGPNLVAIAGGPWGLCPNADVNKVYLTGSGYEHADAEPMFRFFRAEVEALR